MSFGGTVKSGRRVPGGVGRGESTLQARDRQEIDWERVAVFAAGIAVGSVLGASLALLFAPLSGDEARAAIARRGVRLAKGGRDAWDELRDELEWAARRGKRRVGRRVQRARWAAEDFIDERRRPAGWWSKRRDADKERSRKSVEVDDEDVEEIVDALC